MSDVIRQIIPRFAPQLKVTAGSVVDSSFIVEQYAYLQETTLAEMVRAGPSYGLQDWAVWDDNTFYWAPPGTFGRKWHVRTKPSKLQETGQSADRVWESIVVRFDAVDGTRRTVGPPGSGCDVESPYLKDSDPQNPANEAGITRRDILVIGVDTTEGAIEQEAAGPRSGEGTRPFGPGLLLRLGRG